MNAAAVEERQIVAKALGIDTYDEELTEDSADNRIPFTEDQLEDPQKHSVESDLEIPAPYDKYYDLGSTKIDYDELPDAFDNYSGMQVIAEVYAKEEYYDDLSANSIEFCYLVEDDGQLMVVITIADSVYSVSLDEIQRCIGEDEYCDEMDEALTKSQKLKNVSAQEFRNPMQVTDVLYRSGTSFAVCPRCEITLEREYVSYCDRCGQCLSWKGFSKAKVHKV